MGLNSLVLFVLLAIFIASPIYGRPQPNPCLSAIRRLESRFQELEKAARMRTNSSPTTTARPMNTNMENNFEKGRKQQARAEYDRLVQDLKTAEDEYKTADDARLVAVQNVATATAVDPNRNKIMTDAVTLAAQKESVRDYRRKQVEDARRLAGIP